MVTTAQELAGCRERLRWTEMRRPASVLLLSCTAAASGVGGGESSSRVERLSCLTHHTLTISLFCAPRESRININSSPSSVNACSPLKVAVVWEQLGLDGVHPGQLIGSSLIQHIETNKHTQHSPTVSSESSVDPVCVSLAVWRKAGYPEKTCEAQGRTCKLNTDWLQPRNQTNNLLAARRK